MINLKLEKLKLKKIESRHVRIILFMKIVMTVTFVASYYLPPTHAMWVSALTNFIWLWEL